MNTVAPSFILPLKALAIIPCIHHKTLRLDPANSGDHGDLSLRGFVPADNLVALGCSAGSDDVWFDMRSIARSLGPDRVHENLRQTSTDFFAQGRSRWLDLTAGLVCSVGSRGGGVGCDDGDRFIGLRHSGLFLSGGSRDVPIFGLGFVGLLFASGFKDDVDLGCSIFNLRSRLYGRCRSRWLDGVAGVPHAIVVVGSRSGVCHNSRSR